MEEIRILTCPVCGQSVLYHGDDPKGREALKSEAWDHLKTHRLPESEHGIYGVMMVDRMDRRTVEVEVEGHLADEVGEWVDQLPSTVTG